MRRLRSLWRMAGQEPKTREYFANQAAWAAENRDKRRALRAYQEEFVWGLSLAEEPGETTDSEFERCDARLYVLDPTGYVLDPTGQVERAPGGATDLNPAVRRHTGSGSSSPRNTGASLELITEELGEESPEIPQDRPPDSEHGPAVILEETGSLSVVDLNQWLRAAGEEQGNEGEGSSNSSPGEFHPPPYGPRSDEMDDVDVLYEGAHESADMPDGTTTIAEMAEGPGARGPKGRAKGQLRFADKGDQRPVAPTKKKSAVPGSIGDLMGTPEKPNKGCIFADKPRPSGL